MKNEIFNQEIGNNLIFFENLWGDGLEILQRNIFILLMAFVVAFVFCGAASAATVKSNQINVSILKS